MKIGFTTWNYEKEISTGKMTALQVAEEAARLGFNSIEFMGYHLPGCDADTLVPFRRQVEALGLEISAIDARNTNFGGKWSEFRNDVCMIQLWIQVAAILGAPVVSVFLGRFENEAAHIAQHERNIEGIRSCLSYANRYGVSIGIENHMVYGMDEDLAVKHEVVDVLDLIEVIGSDRIGVTPDSDNFFRKPFGLLKQDQQAKVYENFTKLMTRAVHVHFKVKGIDEAGETLQPDLLRLLEIVMQQGYDGQISFEFMKPVVSDNAKVLGDCLAILKGKLQDANVLV